MSHVNSETKETKCNLFDRFVSFPYNDRYASVFRRPEERNFYRFFLAFDFLSYLHLTNVHDNGCINSLASYTVC